MFFTSEVQEDVVVDLIVVRTDLTCESSTLKPVTEFQVVGGLFVQIWIADFK